MARKPTRNANGNGCIRKRSDGRWEGLFTIGVDPATGKQKRKSVYGATQEEVAKKLRKATSSIDENVYTEPSKLTLGGWLEIWLKEYCGNLKESTLSLYKRHTNKKIRPHLGRVKLMSLTTPMIQSYINGLQRGDDDIKPMAPKSIKNIHGVLHRALEFAVELGYLRVNPAHAVKLPRVEPAQIKALDCQDIGSFMEALKGHEYERPLLVDMFTGMRQGEILGLTWDCVDFEKGTIFLYRQLQLIDGEYKFLSLKNNKTRTITPASFVMDALREQRRVQLEWRMKAGAVWEDGDFVFTNEIGQHMARQTLYKKFKSVASSIGLGDMRFHDLRHTYAVSALQSGDDVKTVQEHLGHHTAAFTLDVYGHVTERMRKESAARMDAFIKGINSPS